MLIRVHRSFSNPVENSKAKPCKCQAIAQSIHENSVLWTLCVGDLACGSKRSLWIYPWWVLCWMRDIFNFVMVFCFLVLFSSLLALWHDLQGELVKNVVLRSGYVPSAFVAVIWIITDAMRVGYNRTWPIGISCWQWHV
jgi:hypothetical protein